MSDQIRLSKRLSEQGLCSRREADEFIKKGWVLVNGERISQLGYKVSKQDVVDLSPEAFRSQNSKVTILLNKPAGYVSQNPEDGYLPAIRLIQKQNQIKGQKYPLKPVHLRGLAVAGRLDIDSRGLLIFTQDGTLAKKIIGKDSPIEKEYHVMLDKDVTTQQLERLRGPLTLDDELLKPMKIEQVAPQKIIMTLVQGKKRQIRRVCELVGLRVTSLVRVRVGKIKLEALPEGQWRFLETYEKF